MREELVGEEIILEKKNCVWCSLCQRVKSPNEVASGAGCSPRPMSEVGYSLELGAQEAADKGVFLWGLLISQSISHRADNPNVLVGSWARQERKGRLMHSPARTHLSQDCLNPPA